jgi:GNAT superfamily N-acetyltransferase
MLDDMETILTLRVAQADDLAAVDALLGRSYPALLKGDYAPSIMVTIVPLIARARPELLASGRYFVVSDQDGRVVGAGGYSLAAPGPRGGVAGVATAGLAHIRHVATDPQLTRRGVGRLLMEAIFAAAKAEGVRRFECLSTLTAVSFYQAVGFGVDGPVSVPMAQGLQFPAVRMLRDN